MSKKKQKNPQTNSDSGQLLGNKVLQWPPMKYAIEFIYQMRRNKKRLFNTPSTRQAIAIPKLLLSMYYRKGLLIPDDFIKSAVITTPLEDQDVAYEVAFNILFPDQKKTKSKNVKAKESTVADLIPGASDSQEEDIMKDLLSEMEDLGISLDNLDDSGMIDDGLNEMEQIMKFIDNLYSQAGEGIEPQSSLMNIIDLREGYTGLLAKGFSNLEQVLQHAQYSIQRDMSTLSPQDVQAAANLNWSDDIIQQSSVPWEVATAKYCSKKKDFQNYLDKIIREENVGTAAKSLRYLSESGFPKKSIKKMMENLIKNIQELTEVQEISRVLEEVPDFDMQSVLQASLNKDLGSAFQIARGLDRQHKTMINNELFKQWEKTVAKPDLSEIYQAMADLEEWVKQLEVNIQEQLKNFEKKRDAVNKLSNLARALDNFALQAEINRCRKAFRKNSILTGDRAIAVAKDPDQFLDVLSELVNSKIDIDKTKALENGRKLSIPEETMLEIFGGSFELLKSMFEKKIGNFNRYKKILDKISQLSQQQITELATQAQNMRNTQAMGALGHYNLTQAFQAASQIGGDAVKQQAESLTAGPGDNLLLMWFEHRPNIPSSIKKYVRELTKEALIKIAMNLISNQRGSGEKGLLPSNKLRCFIDGDDMDLVDIDASIENIVMAGKNLDMITADDLMVTDTERGRVALCFLLDVSGSMSGKKLASCSLAVITLIGKLLPEEVAIALFESNTHVIKSFYDHKEIDHVADQLLDLKSMGGTQVQAALEWGQKQLAESDAEMKLCFLLTDCEFFEKPNILKKELEGFVKQRVRFIVAVNTKSYRKGIADLILNETNGEIIKILDFKEIPKIISETLDKIA